MAREYDSLGCCSPALWSECAKLAKGSSRACTFVREVLPILLHYKYAQLRYTPNRYSEQAIEAAWDELHRRYAPEALRICRKMQGFYIKLGQMAAGGGTGIVPQVYLDELSILLEDCQCLDFTAVRKIVESALGPLISNFRYFSKEAIHGASIGQVHEATLHDGQEVVVKVQYPSAEHNFMVDITCFTLAAKFLAPEHLDLFVEIRKNFVNEFNYKQEASLQMQAREVLKECPNTAAPYVVDSLCTKHVLVMERFAGKSLAAWAREAVEQYALLTGKAKLELHRMSPADLEKLEQQQLIPPQLYNASISAYNWSFGWFAEPLEYLPEALGSIDTNSFADTLLSAQGHMIFSAGFLNSDPHPGNLMLLEDGRLGLIDWGQVKRYTLEERCKLARLCIAVADGDEVQAASFMRAMGMRTTYDFDWTYARLAQYYLCSWTSAFIQELGGVLQFEETLNKVDKVVKSVGIYHMVFRNQIFTRQSLALLGFPRVNSARSLRSAAVACLREGGGMPKTRKTKVAVPERLAKFTN
eukprot:TRINITY_DN32747_c0_g1_i1.p1 TRINITY_DN32747_c0_g1~~TRINITY_DN32747_c0_g1_i1.p1  ORF type:complete len:528 (+),score=114.39 TRINITY_DN32747_c0_g1_i1:65-1648(+)